MSGICHSRKDDMSNYLDDYLQRIGKRVNLDLAKTIQKTAKSTEDSIKSYFSYYDFQDGLLFGNIQSGKTSQVLGVISSAADNDFSCFLFLTSDNVVLQKQTFARLLKDLPDFCICDESDETRFRVNALEKPAIIVLKKNSRVLRNWANILKSTQFLKDNPLFIVDDEADAASLNTKVNKKQISTINGHLDGIKKDACCGLYLQVTGTPQALFLQKDITGWKPIFTQYFEPGSGYLGGDFFFSKTGAPDCIEFIKGDDSELKKAVLRHLGVSAQIIGNGGSVCNALFHPSVRQDVHTKTKTKIIRLLDYYRSKPNEFNSEMQKVFKDINPIDKPKLILKEFLIQAEIQLKAAKTIIINSKTETSEEQYSEGCNFIVGGNSLGRGLTFPMLETICYTRQSSTPQADTMWQHSRMFGYDREAGLMKVFITKKLYKLFSDINAANSSVISQLNNGIANVRICFPPGLKPTRTSVLDKNFLCAVSGGTNYYPFDVENTAGLDSMLVRFSEKQPSYEIGLREIRTFLENVMPSPDFRLNAILGAVDTALSGNPQEKGVLIVRRGRKVHQGTGALMSPDDWKIDNDFTDKTVLTMYQIVGELGWKQNPVWVPNIKLPHDLIYYDIN